MATQTSEQTIRLAPFQEEFLADIFKSAENLTESGSSMPFSAQQLAGLSQGQQQAISSALGGVGSFQPFIQKGSEAIGQGIGAVGTGLGTIGSAIGQTAGATYDFDLDAGNNFKLTITTSSALELGFSNIDGAEGQSGTIEIVNGAITPSWGTECHFVGGTVIDLTQSVTSFLSYYVPSATVVVVNELLDVKAQS